jgi:hypothetical protein
MMFFLWERTSYLYQSEPIPLASILDTFRIRSILGSCQSSAVNSSSKLGYADFQRPLAAKPRKFHQSMKDHAIIRCVGTVGTTGLHAGKYRLRYGHEKKIDIGKKEMDMLFTRRRCFKTAVGPRLKPPGI